MQGKHIMKIARAAIAGAALMSLGAPLSAQIATEVSTLGEYTITLHLHPFLNAQDLEILRMIATSSEALALFVPDAAGFSAMAASPDDGFIADGVPTASVVALGGLPDAATAAANATAGCKAASSAASDCVVILEIAPK